jgi:hypothetical protein
MKHEKRLSSEQKAETQEQALNQQQTQQQAAREFGSVDELLRHDALHTPVPPTVAARLQGSINREPGATRSWWRRLFGS